MMDFIKKARNIFSDVFYTVKCPYCRKVINKNEYACKDCAETFPEFTIVTFAVGGYRCISPLPYRDSFAKAVKQFKFRNQGVYAKQFSMLMSERILCNYRREKFDIITCVPMHKKALKVRRFNQAELLARQCAEILKIPYADTLEKIKENKAQHSIKGSERAQNVKGVYRVISKELIKGKNILIIDDIITTGNTLGECARMLKKSECKNICCATVCSV